MLTIMSAKKKVGSSFGLQPFLLAERIGTLLNSNKLSFGQ